MQQYHVTPALAKSANSLLQTVLQATVTAQKFLLLSLPSEPQSQLPRLVQSQS